MAIKKNPILFNSKAKTFQFAFENFKIRYSDIEGLKRFKKSLKLKFGEIDVSILRHEASYNITPI